MRGLELDGRDISRCSAVWRATICKLLLLATRRSIDTMLRRLTGHVHQIRFPTAPAGRATVGLLWLSVFDVGAAGGTYFGAAAASAWLRPRNIVAATGIEGGVPN